MGETQRIPRRPAILDYAQTEAIVGAQDVADSRFSRTRLPGRCLGLVMRTSMVMRLRV